MVKNPPVVQKTQVCSLGWEDLLEKDMKTHPSILAWGIPWTEESGRLQFIGSHRVKHDGATHTHAHEVIKKKTKLKLELPYYPAIQFLGISLEKSLIQKGKSTPMFIAALFAIAEPWKQPSTDEWIKSMWHMCMYVCILLLFSH